MKYCRDCKYSKTPEHYISLEVDMICMNILSLHRTDEITGENIYNCCYTMRKMNGSQSLCFEGKLWESK